MPPPVHNPAQNLQSTAFSVSFRSTPSSTHSTQSSFTSRRTPSSTISKAPPSSTMPTPDHICTTNAQATASQLPPATPFSTFSLNRTQHSQVEEAAPPPVARSTRRQPAPAAPRAPERAQRRAARTHTAATHNTGPFWFRQALQWHEESLEEQ